MFFRCDFYKLIKTEVTKRIKFDSSPTNYLIFSASTFEGDTVHYRPELKLKQFFLTLRAYQLINFLNVFFLLT